MVNGLGHDVVAAAASLQETRRNMRIRQTNWTRTLHVPTNAVPRSRNNEDASAVVWQGPMIEEGARCGLQLTHVSGLEDLELDLCLGVDLGGRVALREGHRVGLCRRAGATVEPLSQERVRVRSIPWRRPKSTSGGNDNVATTPPTHQNRKKGARKQKWTTTRERCT